MDRLAIEELERIRLADAFGNQIGVKYAMVLIPERARAQRLRRLRCRRPAPLPFGASMGPSAFSIAVFSGMGPGV